MLPQMAAQVLGVSNASRRSGAEAPEPFGWNWSSRSGAAAPVRRPRSLLRRSARIGGLALVLVAAVFLAGFFGFVAALERFERRPEGRADGIVALTGGAQRIGDAIDLLAQGYAGRLLITGVNERTSRDEIARLNPGQRRLFDCCVDLDYRARNTIGNAIETRRWIRDNRFKSLIVVTSNYHMPRTLVEIDHAVPGLRLVPYAVVTEGVNAERWWRSPAAARLLVSEYAKFVVGWLRTRVERDPEHSRVAALMGRGRPVKVAVEPIVR
jgi:uncharacterized SAM-binding protein YcdF (DUF218 family)